MVFILQQDLKTVNIYINFMSTSQMLVTLAILTNVTTFPKTPQTFSVSEVA